MGRIILIANRLPVTIHEKKGELKFTPSSGGLATGLKSLEGSYEKVWIGWPGMMSPNEEQNEIIDKELLKLNMHAIHVNLRCLTIIIMAIAMKQSGPYSTIFLNMLLTMKTTGMTYKKVNQIFS